MQEPGCEQAGGILGNVKCQASVASVCRGGPHKCELDTTMYSPGPITPISRRFWGCPVIVADVSSCSSSMMKCGYGALELEGCHLSGK